MGPMTRSNSKKARVPAEKSYGKVASVEDGHSSKYFLGKSTQARSRETDQGFYILSPEECVDPRKAEKVRLRCPGSGVEAVYIVDREREFVGRFMKYHNVSFRSVFAPNEILTTSDPFYVVVPVNPIALITPYLLKHEDTFQPISSILDDTLYPKIQLFSSWTCVLANLELIGEIKKLTDGTIEFKLKRKDLEEWIAQKTLEVYERVKSGTDEGNTDSSALDFAIQLTRQQLPPQLHHAVTHGPRI